MRYVFKFPDIGEGLEEGTIVEWHVEKGQTVKMGDSLVTMETDKVVTAIPSPRDGVIAAKFGKVGETIHVGAALVEIEIEGVSIEEDAKKEAVEEEGAGVVGTLEVAGNSMVLSASKEGLPSDDSSKTSKSGKALATPVARAIAKDLGIDINVITGTGPGNRVTKEDVINFGKEKPSKKVSSSPTPGNPSEKSVEIEPLSQIRKTIAKNMIQSKHNAAHMTVFEEVEISTLDQIRKKYKEIFAKEDVKLTYLAFIIKAVALSLKKYRALNAEMDWDGGNMIYKKYYNIGIAIDTEKGLVVPVIKNADKLSIKEIAVAIDNISAKARDGKLTMDDMKDGTFSITSYGSIGGLFAVPVINYPQAGILGVGRISKKPVVKGDDIVAGLVLPLSLSVDHRIADGGETARFMNSIMDYLADPVSLIMD
ncbi:MAG: dihydrolipoamide acetyltransferase family protein [Bacteroidales bacterium]|nr:dihydrolipoamide acetyltransferase family protein [Bacteroidales bacterium]MDD3299357.1 dihydrolipoamide acetyltransferase family protein [Bacteroidales bacterium]MDD3843809.1 dihydrolipoamide acetyltransferase family protein [Bacteroidales bacterium]MDD4618249.1 dihydrolipoamide acetyltransferase family protein [Bacteroidales bacterium]